MNTDELRRLKRIRSRLMRAVKAERPAHLRQACVELASDIDLMIEGRPVADEGCPSTRRGASEDERDTVPAPGPDETDLAACARDFWQASPQA